MMWLSFAEVGRTFPGLPKGSKMMRLYVDSAAPEKIKGLCLFFVRCHSDIAISAKNVHEVCSILFQVI